MRILHVILKGIILALCIGGGVFFIQQTGGVVSEIASNFLSIVSGNYAVPSVDPALLKMAVLWIVSIVLLCSMLTFIKEDK